jgi:hypothetical protein
MNQQQQQINIQWYRKSGSSSRRLWLQWQQHLIILIVSDGSEHDLQMLNNEPSWSDVDAVIAMVPWSIGDYESSSSKDQSMPPIYTTAPIHMLTK